MKKERSVDKFVSTKIKAYICNMKTNTLHIKEPSKELLEFARGLRANKQEKIMTLTRENNDTKL